MTNEELKQEAIKKAYDIYWEEVKDYVFKNGWCNSRFDVETEFESDRKKTHDVFWRPKSLSGIENNRGWTRIEEDGSNLPSLGYYWVKNREDGEIYNSIIDPKRSLDMIDWFSHYQPIIQPEPPLY